MQLRAERQTFQGTCDELVPFFEAAHAADKQAEKTSFRAGAVGCLTLLFGIGGACFASEYSYSDSLPGGAATIVVATVLVAIGFLVWASRASRGDIDDRKLATAARFVRMIRPDVPRATRLLL